MDVTKRKEWHNIISIQNEIILGEHAHNEIEKSFWKPLVKVLVVSIVFWPNKAEPVIVDVMGANLKNWIHSFV